MISRGRPTIRPMPNGPYLVMNLRRLSNREGAIEAPAAIFVFPNGPYVVAGGPQLLDTPCGEGASTEHFTLCRCGGSKNKPFCDGSHWHDNFNDDKN